MQRGGAQRRVARPGAEQRTGARRHLSWHLLGTAGAVVTALALLAYGLSGRLPGAARPSGSEAAAASSAPAGAGRAAAGRDPDAAPVGNPRDAGAAGAGPSAGGGPATGWGDLRALAEQPDRQVAPLPAAAARLDPGPRWAKAAPAAPTGAAGRSSGSGGGSAQKAHRQRLVISGPSRLQAGESATYWVQWEGGGRLQQVPIWVVARGGEYGWVDIGGELHTRAPGTVLLRAVVGRQWIDKAVEVVPAGS